SAPGAEAIPARGLGILIFGMFCWVSASVASKHIGLPADTMLAASVEMLAAGVLLMLAGLGVGEYRASDLSRIPTAAAGAIVYLAVVGSCLGFTAYAWLLKQEPANRVS